MVRNGLFKSAPSQVRGSDFSSSFFSLIVLLTVAVGRASSLRGCIGWDVPVTRGNLSRETGPTRSRGILRIRHGRFSPHKQTCLSQRRELATAGGHDEVIQQADPK